MCSVTMVRNFTIKEAYALSFPGPTLWDILDKFPGRIRSRPEADTILIHMGTNRIPNSAPTSSNWTLCVFVRLWNKPTVVFVSAAPLPPVAVGRLGGCSASTPGSPLCVTPTAWALETTSMFSGTGGIFLQQMGSTSTNQEPDTLC